MRTGNKGEWSELYVLFKLISDGKLFQSDIDLNRDLENVYDVIRAYKEESTHQLEFFRNGDIEVVKNTNPKVQVAKFTEDEFGHVSKLLFFGIRDGHGKSFKIPEIEEFLEQCQIDKIKADSSTKADVKLRIYDHRLAKETDLGFSIKSLLGGDSTLFNTGAGNNFIYSLEGPLSGFDLNDFNRLTYAPSGRKSKIAYRIQELENKGFSLNFSGIQSDQLWRNLRMIDGDLPEILAHALYYRWYYETSALKKIVDLLEEKDPMDFYRGEKSLQKLYEYKIKRFLTEAAMGMTSERVWLGEYDSFGGVIVAKEDGDVVCFHVYDFNLFRNYLLNNTVFEQSSTGEDKNNPGNKRLTGKKYYYGWPYEEDGLKFKINLQVRFK